MDIEREGKGGNDANIDAFLLLQFPAHIFIKLCANGSLTDKARKY